MQLAIEVRCVFPILSDINANRLGRMVIEKQILEITHLRHPSLGCRLQLMMQCNLLSDLPPSLVAVDDGPFAIQMVVAG